jgi:Holliday junction DNA helicase RuvA
MKTAGLPLPGAAAGAGKLADAQSALAVLGFSPAEITAALRGLDTDALTVEEIIRNVLQSSVK